MYPKYAIVIWYGMLFTEASKERLCVRLQKPTLTQAPMCRQRTGDPATLPTMSLASEYKCAPITNIRQSTMISSPKISYSAGFTNVSLSKNRRTYALHVTLRLESGRLRTDAC